MAGEDGSLALSCSWMSRIAIAPSPTAVATRLIDPWRTSPTANSNAKSAIGRMAARFNVTVCD